MGNFAQDFRYGVRMLMRNRGFTLVAVLTLALGIGANTAIFSVVNAVLLRPLPYPQPDHLVKIWGNFSGIGIPNNQNWISPPEFRDLENLSKCFSQISVIDSASVNLTINGTPQRLLGYLVSPGFFPMLGAQPAAGRSFLPEESQQGRDKVVLLSYGLWQRDFGGEKSVVGTKLSLNGNSYTVVGVMPASFQYPEDADLWAPSSFTPDDLAPGSRGNHGLQVLARIKPELSLEQAREDMKSVSTTVIDQNKNYPYTKFEFAFILQPLLSEMVSDIQAALWILTGAVGLVLLIACANVANLLLVRASAREKEIAIRTALGASRWRLISQLLTESVTLSLLGGVAGLLFARWGLHALISVSSTVFPRVAAASMDVEVLIFTMLISLGTGVVFGLAPAIQSSLGIKQDALKEGGRGSTASSFSQKLRHGLIVGKLALSLVLLNGAGLLLRSFQRLQEVDGGFRPDHVLTMRISLPELKYSKPEQVRGFFNEVTDRISKIPGVQAVGGVNVLPLSEFGQSGTATIDTHSVTMEETTPEADLRVVTPGFFKAMGIDLMSGRYLSESDTDQSPLVAVVDETLANTYWPGESALGKRLKQGTAANKPWRTVVGVVRHVRYRTLEAQSRVEIYWPEAQAGYTALSLAIRTQTDPHNFAATVQKEIQSVDPDQPVYRVRTMDEMEQSSMARRRLSMLLLGIFAGAALLLAAVGIYGIMSYWVNQRSHEMGIRMALGAGRMDVLRLVLRQSVILAGLGVGLGLAGSLALTRLIAGLLFNVKPTDPVTFILVAITLAG
ncbi:MAG TPA: ABC transporter permease, partial [Terriglobia bacterium]|nr:ABC transporter permease [Terriglobia bacterium]